MAETANLLVDTVLQRVRDPQGGATPRSVVRDLLSRIQQLVNARFGYVTASVSFTTTPRTPIYVLADLGVSDVARILTIRDGVRNLDIVPWRSLAQADRRWLRQVGTPAVFARLGLDQFLLWPAPATAQSLTVVYATLTTALAAEWTATELRDERLPIVRSLAELLLLAKQRDFGALSARLATLQTQLVAEA